MTFCQVLNNELSAECLIIAYVDYTKSKKNMTKSSPCKTDSR